MGKACPYCGSTKYKSLKSVGGARVTRCCESAVESVNGVWYKHHSDAPEWIIMSDIASRMGVELVFGDFTYQHWMRGAKTMLQRCGDVSTATSVIELSFDDKRWSWRTYTDIYAMLHGRYFASVLSAAKAKAYAKKRADEVQERRTSNGIGTVTGMELIHATGSI